MNVMSYVELDEQSRKRAIQALVRATSEESLSWEQDGTDRHTCDFQGFHIVVMKEPNPQGDDQYALTVKTKDEPYKKYYFPELEALMTEIQKHEPDVLNDLISALERR
ncbi:MAG: hypothetical protein KC917_07190 [Candidatus Omnitrophica bacterium]|nr:hypothetical protein [Candidatus Omnitrophota bacterium]MCA9416036.1 hypothetical protein [Candidatus Omnitrophota bacterium]MCA9423560.1 hypothetical protein [Candidatus Omnitrophota bacterium]MCA9429195.1 hypothetical protein [Candidatus Omnitrophota bacterium]MCA9435080.1 hypothetical protein [Candidatus Omnitrophota bacterium]